MMLFFLLFVWGPVQLGPVQLGIRTGVAVGTTKQERFRGRRGGLTAGNPGKLQDVQRHGTFHGVVR
jgi:hypothetical protein